MTSKGKTWEVPHRQMKATKLREIFTLIAKGWSTKSVGSMTGYSPRYIQTLLLKRSVGARRLRYQAIGQDEIKVGIKDGKWQVLEE